MRNTTDKIQRKMLYAVSIVLATALILLIALFGQTANEMNAMTQLVGDRDQTNPEPARTSANRYHFVLIVEENNHPYWNLLSKGAVDAAEEQDVLLEITGPFRSSLTEHANLLDKAITAMPDGIFVQGLDDVAETPLINKGVEKGIPIITIDTDAALSRRISYVGTDNYQSGLKLGQYVAAQTKTPQKIALISGSKGATNQRERVNGISDALKGTGHEIIAMGFSNISRVQAGQEAEKILKQYPETTMMIGTSGLDAIGIYDAVRRTKQEEIIIYGYDNLPETLNLVSSGKIKGTVVQEPYEMGRKAVQLMLDYKKGSAIPSTVYTDTRILTAKDVKQP